uniref:Odorant receptor n=1 Tax=Meteorus pulchricornis TaxID=51522 RepID=A0A1S5VFS7_9HYME|nr:olfactory receptor 88 [Meteorus pulchricornis]
MMADKSKTLWSIPQPTNESNHDIKYCPAVSRGILTTIGIWSIDQQVSIFGRIITTTRVVICYFLMIFLFIPCALHTFLEEKDQHKKIKSLGPLIYYLTALAKYSFLVARRNDINQCLNQVSGESQHGSSFTDHKIMLNSAKLSRYIAVVCIVFTYSSSVFFRVIMPLCAGKRVGPNNITIRPLGTPVYKPLFTADESPTYEIVYTLQTMSSLVIGSVTIAAGTLTAVLVLHACGQLQLVMNKIDSFVERSERVDDLFENRIAEVVKHHYRTLSFINSVEVTMNELCLVEFLGCMIEICLIGYYLLTELQRAETIGIITYCVLLISFTFNIFIFCYIGEMLTQQGNKLGLTANMIEWYKLPGKSARDLVLLLAMTNSPYNITAGKMAGLSYKSFSDVLKTSMGYFNLLRKVV